jgi:hypothetical protein
VTAKRDTCVSYLLRLDEGLTPARHFLDSYSAHESGLPHRFLVLRRGYRSADQWRRFEAEFINRGITYQVLDVTENGLDLGAYKQALTLVTEDFVCFLNTFSEILANDWLAHLHRYAQDTHTGLVGATGSYESPYSAATDASRSAREANDWPRYLRALIRSSRLRPHYAPFPNPHVRTNGFMLRRSLSRAIQWPSRPSKTAALRSESGKRGLSAQTAALSLHNLVIGRDGLSYEAPDWPSSSTFRSRDQGNLLIADNRTRQYDLAPPEEREHLGRLAWGPSYQPARELTG